MHAARRRNTVHTSLVLQHRHEYNRHVRLEETAQRPPILSLFQLSDLLILYTSFKSENDLRAVFKPYDRVARHVTSTTMTAEY